VALSLIESSGHIVLIAHKNPDADSLGSACAFYSHLLRLRKKVTLFCASADIDSSLAFLPWFDEATDRFPGDADCMISFDCGSYERLGIDKALPLINFDHHASNTLFGTLNIVDTAAISTTEVVYDFFVANGIKINGKMALSLYAGLIDDSRCFSASGCNAKTFGMAHALIAAGADHATCIEWLYRRRSLASLRVRGILLKQMRLLLDGRLAFFDVRASHLEETGASISECKKVLDEALGMRSVQAAMMQIEHPRGGVKISLRTDGTIDAARIMGHYGGGGHVHRAGTRIKQGSWEGLAAEMMMMIQKEFE